MEESFIPIGAISADIKKVEANSHLVIKDGEIIDEKKDIRLGIAISSYAGYGSSEKEITKESYIISRRDDVRDGVTKGKLYFVTSIGDDQWTVNVYNDHNVLTKVYKSTFDKTLPIVKGSKAVICVQGTKGYFDLDEYVQVIGIEYTEGHKYFVVEKMEFDNMVYTIPAIMLRPLNKNEAEEYQKQLVLNFMKEKEKEIQDTVLAFKRKTMKTQEVYDALDKIIIAFESIHNRLLITAEPFIQEHLLPFEDVLEDITTFKDSLLKETEDNESTENEEAESDD